MYPQDVNGTIDENHAQNLQPKQLRVYCFDIAGHNHDNHMRTASLNLSNIHH